jgi:hypothetical protein
VTSKFRHTRDQAALNQEIAEREITVLPAAAAMILGESTPGWRRQRERRADLADSIGTRPGGHRKNAGTQHQHYMLANRIGAQVIIEGHQLPKRSRNGHGQSGRSHLIARYFDKIAVLGCMTPKQIADVRKRFLARYGCVGLRLEVVGYEPPYTEISWKVTLKPMLERALARKLASVPRGTE